MIENILLFCPYLFSNWCPFWLWTAIKAKWWNCKYETILYLSIMLLTLNGRFQVSDCCWFLFTACLLGICIKKSPLVWGLVNMGRGAFQRNTFIWSYLLRKVLTLLWPNRFDSSCRKLSSLITWQYRQLKGGHVN